MPGHHMAAGHGGVPDGAGTHKAGAGIRRYVTAIQVINTNAVATEFVIKDGATVIWRIWLPASMTTPWDIDFPTPLRSSANAALNAAAITSGASIYLDAQGYTAP